MSSGHPRWYDYAVLPAILIFSHNITIQYPILFDFLFIVIRDTVRPVILLHSVQTDILCRGEQVSCINYNKNSIGFCSHLG